MPQRVVVVFSAQWAFSIFERNVYVYVHTNNCTVIRQDETQARGQTATCFGHLQEGIQQRKVQQQLGCVTDVR
jgi:hypothetical protein